MSGEQMPDRTNGISEELRAMIRQGFAEVARKVQVGRGTKHQIGNPTPCPLVNSDDPMVRALQACIERGWKPAGWARFEGPPVVLLFDREAQLWAIGKAPGGISGKVVFLGPRRWAMTEVEPGVYKVGEPATISHLELLTTVPEVRERPPLITGVPSMPIALTGSSVPAPVQQDRPMSAQPDAIRW